MRDEKYDDTTLKLTLATALRTNGSVNGTAVDSAGNGNFFRSQMLVVIGGTITDGTHTVVLQDSDDGATGWNAVDSSLLQGALVAVTTNSIQRQAYLGSKRYLRAVVSTSGATTGGTTTAAILLAQGSGAPVS